MFVTPGSGPQDMRNTPTSLVMVEVSSVGTLFTVV